MEHFTGISVLSFAMLTGCYIAGMLPLSITLSEVCKYQVSQVLFAYILIVCTSYNKSIIYIVHFIAQRSTIINVYTTILIVCVQGENPRMVHWFLQKLEASQIFQICL